MAGPGKSDSTTQARVAVALRYDHEPGALPQVVAKGHGHIADAIVDCAQKANVPIEHDMALARALADLEIDQTIPPELYRAIAQIIGFLMRKGRPSNSRR